MEYNSAIQAVVSSAQWTVKLLSCFWIFRIFLIITFEDKGIFAVCCWTPREVVVLSNSVVEGEITIL